MYIYKFILLNIYDSSSKKSQHTLLKITTTTLHCHLLAKPSAGIFKYVYVVAPILTASRIHIIMFTMFPGSSTEGPNVTQIFFESRNQDP